MLFEIRCNKRLDEVDQGLRKAAAEHHFGVLSVLDLDQILEQKGLPLQITCRVYEVCNPQQAKQVLDQNPSFSSLLPCRISVYGSGAELKLSTVLPTSLVSLIGDQALASAAAIVEEEIKAVMEAAAE